MGVLTSLLSLLLLVSVVIEARSVLRDYSDYELDDSSDIATINSTSTKNLSLVSHPPTP